MRWRFLIKSGIPIIDGEFFVSSAESQRSLYFIHKCMRTRNSRFEPRCLIVGDGVRVGTRSLTVVLAETAAVCQVHVMTAGQVVVLASREAGASLNASGTGIESLSLRVSGRRSETA